MYVPKPLTMVYSASRKTNSEIYRPPDIIVQDFDEGMFELGTPKDVDNSYKFILSPNPNTHSHAKVGNLDVHWNDGQKIPYDTNSCVLLSPKYTDTASMGNLETFLQSYGLEELAGNGSSERKLPENFLAEVGFKSPNSKLTVFSPKSPDVLFSENFLQELGLNNEDITLVSPKTPNMISTKTPVIVRRQCQGNDELGIYLPPCYTPALVESLQSSLSQQDLTMFPFPPFDENIVHAEQQIATSNGQQEHSVISLGNQPSVMPKPRHHMNAENHSVDMTQDLLAAAEMIFPTSSKTAVNVCSDPSKMPQNVKCSIKPEDNNTVFIAPYLPKRFGREEVDTDVRALTSLYQGMPEHAVKKCCPEVHQGRSDIEGKRSIERKVLSNSVKKAKISELRRQFKEVRLLHNDIERKRRSDMQIKFNKLRDAIPELENDGKPAKVTILKVARRYIRDLEEEGKRLDELKEHEKRRNRELLNRLCLLTRPSGLTA